MYYQHKKYSIESHKLQTINELFDKYDLAELGRISPKDARTLLRQIGIDPNHTSELVLKADPHQRGSVRKENFLEVIREYWGSDRAQKEVQMVFQTIRDLGPDREFELPIPKKEQYITIDDLRAAADRLGESLTEHDLREMMDFADPHRNGYLTISEFKSIMKKTAIW
jgi:Ca2+-binding EF-hand superfamily protein